MNQDFTLPGTPAMARRLLRFSEACSMALDDGIRALAGQDLITPEQFESVRIRATEQQSAVQKLVDMDLRAVLVTDASDTGRTTALAACRLVDAMPLTIISAAERSWVKLCEQHQLGLGAKASDECDVLLLPCIADIHSEGVVTTERRKGALIHDMEADEVGLYGTPFEFRRTIVSINMGRHLGREWGVAADGRMSPAIASLFPDAPLHLLFGQASRLQYGKLLTTRGFNADRAQLYEMCNVVLDLLGERGPGRIF